MSMSPRPHLPNSTQDLLAAAHRGLRDAAVAESPGERYVAAHLAALRAAAALISARGKPSPRSRVRSVWVLLAGLAPEMTEWASFFAAGATRRAAAEAGLNVISQREADDLMRDAGIFLEQVRTALLPLRHSA